jgi:hypothetical protein
MKVKIIKKSIKEGDNYCIKSLYVSFTEPQIYEGIVNHLKAQGCEIDAIEKFCKPNDYNGAISYAFGLNCSNFTFDRVERFGMLDANILFLKNEKGYINAKIQIVDKKEQVKGYESPEDEADGWSSVAPEPKAPEQMGDGSKAETNPIVDNFSNSLDPNAVDDLPF